MTFNTTPQTLYTRENEPAFLFSRESALRYERFRVGGPLVSMKGWAVCTAPNVPSAGNTRPLLSATHKPSSLRVKPRPSWRSLANQNAENLRSHWIFITFPRALWITWHVSRENSVQAERRHRLDILILTITGAAQWRWVKLLKYNISIYMYIIYRLFDSVCELLYVTSRCNVHGCSMYMSSTGLDVS